MTHHMRLACLLAAAAGAAGALVTCTQIILPPGPETATARSTAPSAPTPAAAGTPSPAAPTPTAASKPAINKADFAFYNAKLPLDKRVDDLLSRLTLDEKVLQMQMAAPAIDRLGISPYHWWNEALHGVARNGTATVFPQAIGMAATWNAPLHYQMAQVIATEARAKHNDALTRNNHGQYTGLDLWSPNINIFRDPRWGRGQETYGEDPYLTGRMAVSFVTGLQGNDPHYFETIATPKHYAVHSGPESERHRFNVTPTDQDLYTTYLPAFEAAVREGHAYSVMASYNAVNGLPSSANPRLLTDILRKQWGFEGYVVSDVDAVSDVWRSHGTVVTPEEAAAISVKAGCDLNGGTTYRSLASAVREGLITEKELDVSLRRLLTARFRMGEFDPPGTDPYASIPPTANDTPAHDQLALDEARQSMVLLKNDAGTLPLKKELASIAVIGPTADEKAPMLGNYNGVPSHPVTILQGIRNILGPKAHVYATPGCPIVTEEIPLAEPVAGKFLYTDSSLKTHGLIADYSRSIVSTDRLVRGRIDPTIDLAFPDQLGRDPLPYTDGMYVKWTGILVPPDTGDYQLGLNGKDSFRLFLDGKPLVDQFYGGGKRSSGYAVHLEHDHPYALTVELVHPTFETNSTAAPALPPAQQGLAQAQQSFTNAPPAGSVDEMSLQLRWTRPTTDGLAAGTNGQNLYADALSAARSADAVVLVLGITSALEREQQSVHYVGFNGGDRTSLDLPLVQERMLEQVTAAAAGKPVTLVLMNGSALSVNWANEHVPAIVEAWYPGQHGDAVADVLFGDYNPAGRLPVTFYKSVDDLPAFTDYSMQSRTYRYFSKPVLYPFGYGLSYTTFNYGNMTVYPGRPTTHDNIVVAVPVKNTGTVAGDEVVQCYLDRAIPADARNSGEVTGNAARDQAWAVENTQPAHTLVGFSRVSLKPGEQKTVTFTITPYQYAAVDFTGQRVANPTELNPFPISVRVGPNSATGNKQVITLTGAPNTAAYGYVAPKVN